MIDRSLRSGGRVLRLPLTLDGLSAWCEIDLIVKVLLGFFHADHMMFQVDVVDAIGYVLEGCSRDSIRGRVLLLDRPRWTHRGAGLGQDGLGGWKCIAIDDFGAVCVLRPGGGRVSLHAARTVVAFEVAVLAVGNGRGGFSVVAVVGVSEGVISVAVLIVVLSRFASKDG